MSIDRPMLQSKHNQSRFSRKRFFSLYTGEAWSEDRDPRTNYKIAKA